MSEQGPLSDASDPTHQQQGSNMDEKLWTEDITMLLLHLLLGKWSKIWLREETMSSVLSSLRRCHLTLPPNTSISKEPVSGLGALQMVRRDSSPSTYDWSGNYVRSWEVLLGVPLTCWVGVQRPPVPLESPRSPSGHPYRPSWPASSPACGKPDRRKT